MSLAALAPQWLTLLLAGLLLAAAIEDAVRLRISNLTCLAIFGAGVIALWLTGIQAAVWQNIIVCVALLIAGTPLFAFGKMGGGDIKLIAVTGFWFDLQGALILVASVLIAGGILAIFLIGFRRLKRSVTAEVRPEAPKRGGVIPYGVAISAGAMFSISLATPWAQSFH